MQRDFIVMVVLIVLNSLILNFYSKMIKQKKTLVGSGLPSSNKVTNAERSVNNQRITIYAVCLNYFFGHIAIFIYNILYYLESLKSQSFFACFEELASVLFYFSYATSILLIYFLNKHFRFYAIQNIKNLIQLY